MTQLSLRFLEFRLGGAKFLTLQMQKFMNYSGFPLPRSMFRRNISMATTSVLRFSYSSFFSSDFAYCRCGAQSILNVAGSDVLLV